MRRLRRLLALSREERALLFEAAAFLAASRAALALLPFRRLAPWLGTPGATPRAVPTPDAGKIAWALHAAARHLPWDSSCLVRALAGKAMLACRGVPSTIHLGVARPGAHAFTAHAWLRAGDAIVAGGREAADHLELLRFA